MLRQNPQAAQPSFRSKPTATLPLQAIASGPAEAAHSGIREVVNLALVTPGCIRLEVGEPNFSTPKHIVEAAVEFARKGQVKYTATAAVFPREQLEQLVEVAVRHNIYLLSDECYDEVILEGEHLSPASFCTDGRVISAFTFSKTYAMTGWRVGYVVANDTISDSITKILESNSSCIPTVCQKAAEAALDGPREPLREMVDAYRDRRDLCVGLLDEAEMLISRPRGAFYIMADITRSGMDS